GGIGGHPGAVERCGDGRLGSGKRRRVVGHVAVVERPWLADGVTPCRGGGSSGFVLGLERVDVGETAAPDLVGVRGVGGLVGGETLRGQSAVGERQPGACRQRAGDEPPPRVATNLSSRDNHHHLSSHPATSTYTPYEATMGDHRWWSRGSGYGAAMSDDETTPAKPGSVQRGLDDESGAFVRDTEDIEDRITVD